MSERLVRPTDKESFQESFLIVDSRGDLIGFGLDGKTKKPALIVTETNTGGNGLQVNGIVYPNDPEYEEVIKLLPEEPRPLNSDGIFSERLLHDVQEDIRERAHS